MATRCTACGTVFRVVPDQLRVSEGWVRCGRCSEVFNAAEALLDLDTGAPRAPLDDMPRAMVRSGNTRPPPPAGPPPALADFGLPMPPPASAPRVAPPPFDDEAPVDGSEPAPTVDEAVSRFAADAAMEADRRPGVAAAPENPAVPAEDITADPRPMAGATPSFVRQAERAARWRRPQVRAALGLGLVLGGVLLAAQVALAYRSLVAARFPALRPVLQAACQPLGCQVGPAHLIESLVVESSGLVRVEKSSIYKLSVALRNRAELDVALPALELSLTDGQGQLVARRVLTAAELGVNQATLGAGRELAVQATLRAATAPVAGYTIELFYP
ncbi:hypothetical protein IP87_08565 [beta proteobacterium AAP121]|nr:hypothetical protein IP80_18185 [beta proteobacterium AAP65]KPF98478.1 hypothetical protein IP87_08565 [beta proteobacterium AAP121]